MYRTTEGVDSNNSVVIDLFGRVLSPRKSDIDLESHNSNMWSTYALTRHVMLAMIYGNDLNATNTRKIPPIQFLIL